MRGTEEVRNGMIGNSHPLEDVNQKPIRMTVSGLTPRETEVAWWVARGLTNKSIASHLHVSSRTVQTHLERMFKKLRIRSRVELVARAYRKVGECDKCRKAK